MTSFGFSVGDVVLVSKYVYSAYRSIPHAGEEYVSIAEDIRYLHLRLRELDREDRNPISLIHRATPLQKKEIRAIVASSHTDLRSLTKLIAKYKSLRTADPRTRDKVRFTANRQAEIRGRIRTHSDRLSRLLSVFQTQALVRLEESSERQMEMFGEIIDKLNGIMKDIKAGQKDVSVLEDVESWCSQDKEVADETFVNTNVEVVHNLNSTRSRSEGGLLINAYHDEYISDEKEEDDTDEGGDSYDGVDPRLSEENDQIEKSESVSETETSKMDEYSESEEEDHGREIRTGEQVESPDMETDSNESSDSSGWPSEEENASQKQANSKVSKGNDTVYKPTSSKDLHATVEDCESADESEVDGKTSAASQSERIVQSDRQPELPLSSNKPKPSPPLFQHIPFSPDASMVPPRLSRPPQSPTRASPLKTNPIKVQNDSSSDLFTDSDEEYVSDTSIRVVFHQPNRSDSNRIWNKQRIPRQGASRTRSRSPTLGESHSRGWGADNPFPHGSEFKPEVMKIKATVGYRRMSSGTRQEKTIQPRYFNDDITVPRAYCTGGTVFWKIELGLSEALYGWDRQRLFPDGAFRSLHSRCPTLGNWQERIEGEGDLIPGRGQERGVLSISVKIPHAMIEARESQRLGDSWHDQIQPVKRARRLNDWPKCTKSSSLKGREYSDPWTNRRSIPKRGSQYRNIEKEHRCDWECTWEKNNPVELSNDFVIGKASQRLTGRRHYPSEFLERYEHVY